MSAEGKVYGFCPKDDAGIPKIDGLHVRCACQDCRDERTRRVQRVEAEVLPLVQKAFDEGKLKAN